VSDEIAARNRIPVVCVPVPGESEWVRQQVMGDAAAGGEHRMAEHGNSCTRCPNDMESSGRHGKKRSADIAIPMESPDGKFSPESVVTAEIHGNY
jgi:hypothetical protein